VDPGGKTLGSGERERERGGGERERDEAKVLCGFVRIKNQIILGSWILICIRVMQIKKLVVCTNKRGTRNKRECAYQQQRRHLRHPPPRVFYSGAWGSSQARLWSPPREMAQCPAPHHGWFHLLLWRPF